MREGQKFDVLCRLLDVNNPDSAIVFGRTKRRVSELAEALSKRGYSADGIHGDLTQPPQRDTVMRLFRDGAVEILVATDVAARGLDVSGVTHVFNFDILRIQRAMCIASAVPAEPVKPVKPLPL